MFARTIDQWGESPEVVGDKRLSKLMEHPRDSAHEADPTKIAWLGCGNDPPFGMFTVRGLVQQMPESRLSEDSVRDAPLDALTAANAVILRKSCDYLARAAAEIPRQFKTLAPARRFERLGSTMTRV